MALTFYTLYSDCRTNYKIVRLSDNRTTSTGVPIRTTRNVYMQFTLQRRVRLSPLRAERKRLFYIRRLYIKNIMNREPNSPPSKKPKLETLVTPANVKGAYNICKHTFCNNLFLILEENTDEDIVNSVKGNINLFIIGITFVLS